MNVNAVAGLWDSLTAMAGQARAATGIDVTPTSLANAILVAHFPASPKDAAALVQDLNRRTAVARAEAE